MASKLVGQLKSRALWAAAVIVALGAIVGGWWYYSRVYTKTPAYAVGRIQASVQKHDTALFNEYVDVDKVASEASTALLEGMLDADASLTEAGRQTVSTWAAMFKAPLDYSIKGIVNEYVSTGELGGQAAQQGNLSVDSDIILNQAGLKTVSARGLEGVEVDSERQTATASVKVYQDELGEEYTLTATMTPDESGRWRVTGVSNLREFVRHIAGRRREQLQAYLAATSEMMARHDASAKECDAKMTALIHTGGLRSEETRRQLKQIVDKEVAPKWQQRQEELKAVNVPASAQTLHHLRLRICDLQLSYWHSYADWLETKSVATVRRAGEKMKDIKTLEREAEILTRQLSVKS